MGRLINSFGISYHITSSQLMTLSCTMPSSHSDIRVSNRSLPVQMTWLVGTSGMTYYSTPKKNTRHWCQATRCETWSVRRPSSVRYKRSIHLNITGTRRDDRLPSIIWWPHYQCRPSSNCHIRVLYHIHLLINRETANTIACSIACTRLDSCNSVLYEVTESKRIISSELRMHWRTLYVLHHTAHLHLAYKSHFTGFWSGSGSSTRYRF